MKSVRTWLAGAAPFALLWAAQSGAHSRESFADVTPRSHIGFMHQSSATSHKYLIESMGSGVALLDYDGDGELDIFFVNGAAIKDPMRPGDAPDKSVPGFWNRLYRNNGDGSFTDVTERARVEGSGYGMGVAAADYDNDGHTDLYVTQYGRNILYHNNGDGTFTDVTARSGTGSAGWSAGAMFIDYDRDGLLDLIVTRYLEWNFSMDVFCGLRQPGGRMYCHPDQFHPISSLIFHNEGSGKFKDVSAQCGFADHPGKALGIAMEDFDRDGWPDVFVANDSEPQQLFRNRRDGTFEEAAKDKNAAWDADGNAFAGMGVDFSDYDNDGWPDVFVNALATQRYALFRNVKGAFDYVSDSTGVGAATMLHSGWGAKFIDFDNDGWKDLFVAQGHVMDNVQLTRADLRYLEAPLLLRNEKGRFVDVSGSMAAALRKPVAARGAAFGDLNNNGWIDIVINVNNGPPIVMQNQRASGNHWLTIETIGGKSNRDGIGTRVHLTTASEPEQFAMVTTASSYLSSGDKRVHFGLGSNHEALKIELDWPSGRHQVLEHVRAEQMLTVREP